jgi:hypothetical protein
MVPDAFKRTAVSQHGYGDRINGFDRYTTGKKIVAPLQSMHRNGQL